MQSYPYAPAHTPTSEAVLHRIREQLPEFVSGKRLEHTFFVEKEAIALAEMIFLVYNIKDSYKSDISAAALLHDLTKQKSLDEQLSLCERFGIDPGEAPSAAILHAKTAACLARKLFGINDTVFSAIYNHTTGKPDMNVFDKIIFLSDYIEPSRIQESCCKARAYFYNQCQKRPLGERPQILDETIVMSIDATLVYLIETGKCIDIATVQTHNSLLKNMDF